VSKRKAIVLLSLVMVLVVLFAVLSVLGPNEKPVEIGIYDYRGFAHVIKLGLDLKGGVTAVFAVDLEGEDEETLGTLDARIDGTIRSLQDVLFSKGYTEAVVSKQGVNGRQIRVEVPDVEDPETLFSLIGNPATLEFKFNDEVLVTGEHVSTAYVSYDENMQYVVALEFKDAKVFEEATTIALGNPLEIWVNGKKISQPVVNSVINNGKAVIQGIGDYDKCYNLATQIQSGAFGVKLTMVETKAVSASLGVNALRNSIIAGVIGIALIFIFMISVYKMFGVAASLALSVYTVVLIVFLGMFPFVQLTLPGVAGIILGIGMAVDANIIIFERIKEEYKLGKPLAASVDNGFKRAFTAILDGNVSTVLGAFVLFFLATSDLKSFAIVLIISVMISFFSALTVTRMFINIFMTLMNDEGRLYGLKREAANG